MCVPQNFAICPCPSADVWSVYVPKIKSNNGQNCESVMNEKESAGVL